MQPLKDGEDTVAKFGINSDSIVFDRQGAELSVRFGPDVNPWRFLISELDGISDEVLEQLSELSGVAMDHRQRVPADLRLALFYRDSEIVHRMVHQLGNLDGFQGFPLCA